jgi:Ni/Fe-hydrogenase subunit HybB-like protein
VVLEFLFLMVVSFVMFLLPSGPQQHEAAALVCAMAFVGIWIEKGMGLIVPGYIPSPIGEVTEYYPTFIEWMMTAGIWAFGFFVLTILLKGAIGILLGDIKFSAPPGRRGEVR